MGWTFAEVPRATLVAEITAPSGARRTLKHTFRGTTLWCLHETAGHRWIGCYLFRREVKHVPGERKPRVSWGYKDMDESMGPYYYTCPVAYVDAASPTTDAATMAWRAKVREHAAMAAAQKAARPRAGEVWGLVGSALPRVTITQERPIMGRADNGRVYRIPARFLGARVE